MDALFNKWGNLIMKEAVLEQLEISDEIVFTHIHVETYIAAEIKK